MWSNLYSSIRAHNFPFYFESNGILFGSNQMEKKGIHEKIRAKKCWKMFLCYGGSAPLNLPVRGGSCPPLAQSEVPLPGPGHFWIESPQPTSYRVSLFRVLNLVFKNLKSQKLIMKISLSDKICFVAFLDICFVQKSVMTT